MIMKPLSLLLLFCFAELGCWAQPAGISMARSETVAKYKLLWKDESGPASPVSFITYRISVDRRPDKQGCEKLICELLRKENPKNYQMLSVVFYYALDNYFSEDQRVYESLIASYSWNAKLPGNRFALAVLKDQEGKRYSDGPLFYPFDHVKDCNTQK